MKTAVIAVTERGARLGLKVSGTLKDAGHDTEVYKVPSTQFKIEGVDNLNGPLSVAMGEMFVRYRGLVMIMAMGIAVRAIAPHLKDKRKDPAVVVMDEGGSFAVSVLSGHAGGANDMARLIASATGAQAVITTATDVQGAPAVDVIARDLKLDPEPEESVKKINAALARGEKIRLYSEYKLPLKESEYITIGPWDLRENETALRRVFITGKNIIDIIPGKEDLLLRPRNIVVGVGCKKGIPAGDIIKEIKRALDGANRSPLCLRALATIEEKAAEEGILAAARELGVPVHCFNKEEINHTIKKYGLPESEYVMGKMGVGGVCEPAALLACKRGMLLVGKAKGKGITLALAEEESGWWE